VYVCVCVLLLKVGVCVCRGGGRERRQLGLKQINIADPPNGGKCQKLSTKTVRDVVLDYYTIQCKVVM